MNDQEKYQVEEILMKYRYSILRPGGNDTALVRGIVRDPVERKKVNDAIMQRYPNVEQVGFVNLDPQQAELVMAGGEFCGNATRSTAWEILNGKPGEVLIKVSGVSQRLRAGVDQQGNAWAEMPIGQSLDSVASIDRQTDIVTLDGITQVVTYQPLPSEITAEELKRRAYQMLAQYGLTQSIPAAGVMFVERRGQQLALRPVVWVRDIQTLFYETACGSGTTAVGLQQAKQRRADTELDVIQPSGLPIRVQVQASSIGFQSARISGPIQKLRSNL